MAEWISIEKEMPESYLIVLVVINSKRVSIGHFDIFGRFHCDEKLTDTSIERPVTYWQYLPEPPVYNEHED